MKFLVIVNVSPWSSSLATAALRFVRAVLASGSSVETVYFRAEGVYNALPGRATDAGTPALFDAWQDIARDGAELLVCRSSSQRRLERVPDGRFREAGLAELMERFNQADRMISF